MARAARKDTEDFGEIKPKDFAQAVKLYRNDIRPAAGRVGENAQEMSTAYKTIKKQCNIQPGMAKFAFKMSETEEAKRDDQLRCLHGLFKELGIQFPPRDMVDAMQDTQDGYARPKPQLVTIPTGPDGDGDLAGDA